MARTDRLMRLMDVLRRLPAPVTAARLAAETGVSARQLYRDIATLRAGGALIDGEAGLGYRLTEDPALPPQQLTRIEVEALQLAVAQLPRLADPALVAAGESALARLVAALPERRAHEAIHSIMRFWAPADEAIRPQVDMTLIRRACWNEAELRITYRDLKHAVTTREIWPLGIGYTRHSLTMIAMCRMRGDYRLFHISRIMAAEVTGVCFAPRRAGLLREYAARCQAAAGEKIARPVSQA